MLLKYSWSEIKAALRLALFVFCIASLPLCGHAQVANFTADVTSGCAPLVVHFMNTSTNATSYQWDLGNTVNTTQTNTSTSYSAAGTYTVTLTAFNGPSSSVHRQVITVYPIPTVAFTANDTAICPGTAITFTSTSSANMPGSLSYTWNFGDGLFSTSVTPTHTFNDPGYKNITLLVSNAANCQGSLTRAAYIDVYTPAVIDFSVNNTHFCGLPGHAIFTNLVTGTAPFIFAWSLGDGGTSTQADPIHDYLAAGSETVQLKITDGHGCVDSLSRPAYIYVSAVNAGFNGPATSCAGNAVTFNNTSTAYTSGTWYFGDGNSAVANASDAHAFATQGNYTVMLVVYDGFCYDTAVQNINITPGPAADFAISPSQPCPAPVPITFTATAPSATSIHWFFNDGGTGMSNSIAHTFATNGIHAITMEAHDAAGCVTSVFKSDTQYNLILTVVPTPNKGCIPLQSHFNVIATTNQPDTTIRHPYPYAISSYSWDFGDGSPLGSGANPIHTYVTVGTFHVRVTVTTASGCTATDTTTVLAGRPPAVTFITNPTHICTDRTVTLTATSADSVNEYLWHYGDNLTSDEPDSVSEHKYIMPGVYTPTLTPLFNGCPGPDVHGLPVTVDSPKAQFLFTYSCSPRTSVTFVNTSLGANSVLWLFGDGTSSTQVSPSHSYPAAGTYQDTLVAYNAASGCRDTSIAALTLSKPVLDLSVNHNPICRDDQVQFTATVTGGSATLYRWLANGNLIGATPQNTLNATFNNTGIYTIMLVINDNSNCADTLIKPSYLVVAKPVASITASATTGCAPFTVGFADHSTHVPGTFFSNFFWDFGDGAGISTTSVNVSHTYTAQAVLNVREIVTDNVGCKDTLFLPSYISVYHPVSVFMANNVHPCPGGAVSFTNQSNGIASSKWFFGDGGTATTYSAVHTYSVSGIYTVTMVVTAANGCTDTARYINYITVARPVAAFSMTDTFSICPPLSTSFINNSLGASTYNWTFGDGNTSVATSPSDVYTAAGQYYIRLIATNVYGCKDTTNDSVRIFGYNGAFTYSPIHACLPLNVSFNAGVSNAYSFIWDFGDGNTSPASNSALISHVYSMPGAYLPKLVLSDNTGCQSSSVGADTIKADTVYAGFTGPDTVCSGRVFSLVDTSLSYWSAITSHRWSFGTDTSSMSIPSFSQDTAGTYQLTLTVTDGWGCTSTATRALTIAPMPFVAPITGPNSVCVGNTIVLSDSISGGTWSIFDPVPATISVFSNGSSSVAAISPGVDSIYYTVTRSGCSVTVSKEVDVYGLPPIGLIIGQDRVCVDALITLSDGVAGGKWTSGNVQVATIDSTNGHLHALAAGVDTITYTEGPNVNGCYSVAVFTVTVTAQAPFSVVGAVTKVKCYGDSTGGIVLAITNGTPSIKYQWSNTATTNTINGLDTGMYTVNVTDTVNKCVLTESFYISQPDSLHIATETKKDLCERALGGITTTVSGGTPEYTYLWNNNTTEDHLQNLLAGVYTLTVTDANSCMQTITVTVEEDTCNVIVIHDAITPNGDGVNDVWVIEGIQGYPDNTVQIFDKWGDLLFERAGYNNDWACTGKNGLLPDGTYYYLIKLNAKNAKGGDDHFTGSLLIKR